MKCQGKKQGTRSEAGKGREISHRRRKIAVGSHLNFGQAGADDIGALGRVGRKAPSHVDDFKVEVKLVRPRLDGRVGVLERGEGRV